MKPVNDYLIIEDTDQPALTDKEKREATQAVLYTPPAEQTHIRRFKIVDAPITHDFKIGGYIAVKVADLQPFFGGKYFVKIDQVIAVEAQ